jgi:hypothetical protein
VVLFLFGASPALCSEDDHFSSRGFNVEDSGPQVDKLIGEALVRALKNLNQVSGKACDEVELYDMIYAELGGLTITEVESLLENAKNIPAKPQTTLKDSPYTPMAAVGLNPTGKTCCSRIYKIYGVEAGSDKIGHFFSDAYQGFYLGVLKYEGKRSSAGYARKIIEKYQLHTEKKSEEAVLEISDEQERGLWGLQGTGIYSYADIAANFDGYKFWSSLARGKDPYFSCNKGLWKQARSFSLKEYVSSAWDESVNCSDYLPEFQKEISLNISKVLKKQNLKETACPVVPAQCRGLGQRYKQWASKVIHPLCLKAGA